MSSTVSFVISSANTNPVVYKASTIVEVTAKLSSLPGVGDNYLGINTAAKASMVQPDPGDVLTFVLQPGDTINLITTAPSTTPVTWSMVLSDRPDLEDRNKWLQRIASQLACK